MGGAEREDRLCGLIFVFLKAGIDLGDRSMASRSLEIEYTGKGGGNAQPCGVKCDRRE